MRNVPSIDITHVLGILVPHLPISIQSTSTMTIEDEIVSYKRKSNGLVLEGGNMPSVVDPVIDIIRVLQEPMEIDLSIVECQIEDLVHIATISPEPQGDLLDIISELDDSVRTALFDGCGQVVGIVCSSADGFEDTVMRFRVSFSVLILDEPVILSWLKGRSKSIQGQ
jgi:hypothetical protein